MLLPDTTPTAFECLSLFCLLELLNFSTPYASRLAVVVARNLKLQYFAEPVDVHFRTIVDHGLPLHRSHYELCSPCEWYLSITYIYCIALGFPCLVGTADGPRCSHYRTAAVALKYASLVELKSLT